MPFGAVGSAFAGEDTRDLEQVQADALTALGAQFAARVAAGYSTPGGVVDIDDGARANLTALATTALAVQGSGGAMSWPADYARGWIVRGGARVSLAGPEDGITFAFAAGGCYAAVVQHEGDLQAQIEAATTAAAVQAIDVTAGWP